MVERMEKKTVVVGIFYGDYGAVNSRVRAARV